MKKDASLHEIKKELLLHPPSELVELCIRIAKYKKENKELLGYLLFEADDKTAFLKNIKSEMDVNFKNIDIYSNLYFIKKSLRKQLRILTKYNKFSADKALSAEVLIYFCKKLKTSGIPYQKSQQLVNLFEQQLKKINGLIETLHEDLQYDLLKEVDSLGK